MVHPAAKGDWVAKEEIAMAAQALAAQEGTAAPAQEPVEIATAALEGPALALLETAMAVAVVAVVAVVDQKEVGQLFPLSSTSLFPPVSPTSRPNLEKHR